ncbi:MAG: glutathione S-transferase family protein [Bermanella sp.]
MSKELLTQQTQLSVNNVASLILYSSAPSPCVRRVRITLIEKGLEFDTVEISLPNMEQRSEAYMALNPNGYVPTMSHGKQVIFESSVINQYLEEQFPQVSLMPQDPAGQAQVAMWIEAEATMAKIFRPLMYQRIQAPVVHITRTLEESLIIVGRASDDAIDHTWQKKVWNRQVLSPSEESKHQRKLLDWLELVEVALVNQEYLVGNKFSQADISLFPRIDMYADLDIEISPLKFPNVLSWMTRLQQRPSFELSMTEEAKKLRKMTTSPLLPKIRRILGKPKKNVMDKLFIWGIGRIMRKLQKVEQLLNDNYQPRALPLPKEPASPITFKSVAPFNGQLKKASITLYGSIHSVHSQRIVALLDQLNIKYQYEEINLQKNQHKTAGFLRVNPHGQVPVLKHGAQVIYDSTVIAQYLSQLFDKKQNWFPTTSWQSAQHSMWLALEAGTHKEFKPLWDKYIVKTSHQPAHSESEQQSFTRIYQKLTQLENALQQNAFLCGDQIRYADIAWFTRLEQLSTIPGVNLAQFSALNNWQDTVSELLASEQEKSKCL